MSFEEILKGIIDNFSPSQKTNFLRWANVQDKIQETRKSFTQAKSESSKWNNLNQIFIVFSVIVPIITTSLTSTLNLTVWANLLSAVFPVLVGLILGKTKVWGQKRDGYSSIISQYERLLSDVVEDIYSNSYTSAVEDKYKKDFADIETEHRRIDALS